MFDAADILSEFVGASRLGAARHYGKWTSERFADDVLHQQYLAYKENNRANQARWAALNREKKRALMREYSRRPDVMARESSRRERNREKHRLECMQRRRSLGIRPRAEYVAGIIPQNRVLSLDDAKQIRSEFTGLLRGEMSNLARRYGVRYGVVWRIIREGFYK